MPSPISESVLSKHKQIRNLVFVELSMCTQSIRLLQFDQPTWRYTRIVFRKFDFEIIFYSKKNFWLVKKRLFQYLKRKYFNLVIFKQFAVKMIIDTSQWAFISAKLYYQRLKRITESAKQNFFLSLHSHRNVQTHSRLFWHAQSSLAFFGLSLSLTILIHSFFFVDGAFLHSLLLTALISTSPCCPSAWEIKIKFVTFFYINQVFLLRLKLLHTFLS